MYLREKKKKGSQSRDGQKQRQGAVLKVPTVAKEKSWIWSMDWSQFHGSNNGVKGNGIIKGENFFYFLKYKIIQFTNLVEKVLS